VRRSKKGGRILIMITKFFKSLLVVMTLLATFTPAIASAHVLSVTTSVKWINANSVSVKAVVRHNGPADVYATLRSIRYSCVITSRGKTIYNNSKSEQDNQVLRNGDSIVRFHIFNFKLPDTKADYEANGNVNVDYSYTDWKNKK